MKLFCNSVYVASLETNTTTTKSFTITSENDFLLSEIRSSEFPNVFITIKNSNGELFSNDSFDSGMVGKGSNCLKLMNPVILNRNTTIDVTIENKNSSAIENFNLQFWGYKI